MPSDNAPGSGLWLFLTKTRVGSTTPLGCVIQLVLTGLAAALVVALVLRLA